ncbi:MAG TPA: FtsQ-type POTRA domain-containing protein, partial [Chitinophagaceae bacterium]
MKYWLSIILLLIFSGITTAQPTQVSIIDFYGLQKTSEQTIRKELKIKEGDSIQNIDKQSLIKQLESIPGIHKADVGAVCCDDKDGKWIIYIGVAESPVSKHGYNPAPTGSESLPDQTIKDYEDFMGLVYEAVTKGESGENRINGYSFMTYPPAKEVQERMIKYAQNNQQQIREVLVKSANPNHRQA